MAERDSWMWRGGGVLPWSETGPGGIELFCGKLIALHSLDTGGKGLTAAWVLRLRACLPSQPAGLLILFLVCHPCTQVLSPPCSAWACIVGTHRQPKTHDPQRTYISPPMFNQKSEAPFQRQPSYPLLHPWSGPLLPLGPSLRPALEL